MSRIAAHDCRDMSEVRAEIDRIDAVLVDLIAERFAYVARDNWKTKPSDALVTWRIQDVVNKVRSRATARGLPSDPRSVVAADDGLVHTV